MGVPRPDQSAPGDGPASAGAPLILLAELGSGVERALVKRRLREVDVRPSAVLPLVAHQAATLVGEWTHPYERATAVFPAGPAQAADKYWPPVRRIDGAYGDRNLVCSCPPVADLAES